MKKLLLGLGACMSVIAPIVAVVSCGKESTDNTNKETPTAGTAEKTKVKVASLTSTKGIVMKGVMEATTFFDVLTKATITRVNFPAALPQKYTFEGTKGGVKVVLEEVYSFSSSFTRKVNAVALVEATDVTQWAEFSKVMNAMQDNDEFYSMD